MASLVFLFAFLSLHACVSLINNAGLKIFIPDSRWDQWVKYLQNIFSRTIDDVLNHYKVLTKIFHGKDKGHTTEGFDDDKQSHINQLQKFLKIEVNIVLKNSIFEFRFQPLRNHFVIDPTNQAMNKLYEAAK